MRINAKEDRNSILHYIRLAEIKLALLIIIFITVFITSFMVGRYPLTLDQLIGFLGSKLLKTHDTLPDVVETVVMNVRLPRILGATLVGASLSASGVAYQSMFKNPLASPDILGASAGAAFGASLAIYFSLNNYGIQFTAFIFGIASVILSYTISKTTRIDTVVSLILTGILVGTLFSSAISLIKYIADPFDKLPAITFWLMGSLSGTNMQDIKFVSIPMILSLAVLYILRWQMSVLSLGDDEAKTLGINTESIRLILILCSTVLTATSVCLSGVIGWVGLVIPNLARLLVGFNYKYLLPVTMVMGSIFLIVVDNISRGIFSAEVPLGILTAFVGAPFFLILLYKGGR